MNTIPCIEPFKNLSSQLPEAQAYWVAYSGGVDSHVLLYLLTQTMTLTQRGKLQAIHVNHGLNVRAQMWQQHCERVCNDLNVPLRTSVLSIELQANESLETGARRERYRIFAELLNQNECLLTAHHLNDQIETLFLHLFRGSGVKGLSAMQTVRPFARGVLCRPLLTVTKDQLKQFAREHHLVWIEDDSNHNLDFNRNYVRHKVMPVIQDRWPAITKTINRTINHMAQTHVLLEEIASEDYLCCQGTEDNTLSVTAVGALSFRRQNNLLRHWITAGGWPLPNQEKILEIQRVLLNCKADANPLVSWGEIHVRRYRNNLYIFEGQTEHDNQTVLPWQMPSLLTLPAKLGIIMAKPMVGQGIQCPVDGVVEIRFRQGGERCLLPHRQGHHALKKLFQQWGVPPWQRNRVPLIYCNDQLACVVGHANCVPFTVDPDQTGWEIYLDEYERL